MILEENSKRLSVEVRGAKDGGIREPHSWDVGEKRRNQQRKLERNVQECPGNVRQKV